MNVNLPHPPRRPAAGKTQGGKVSGAEESPRSQLNTLNDVKGRRQMRTLDANARASSCCGRRHQRRYAAVAACNVFTPHHMDLGAISCLTRSAHGTIKDREFESACRGDRRRQSVLISQSISLYKHRYKRSSQTRPRHHFLFLTINEIQRQKLTSSQCVEGKRCSFTHRPQTPLVTLGVKIHGSQRMNPHVLLKTSADLGPKRSQVVFYIVIKYYKPAVGHSDALGDTVRS